jgi:hypothetical protein
VLADGSLAPPKAGANMTSEAWAAGVAFIEALPRGVNVLVLALEGPLLDVDAEEAHLGRLWAEAAEEQMALLKVRGKGPGC